MDPVPFFSNELCCVHWHGPLPHRYPPNATCPLQFQLPQHHRTRDPSATYLVQFLRSALHLLGIVSSIPRMVLPLLLVILLFSISWTFQTRAPSRTMDPFSIPKLSFPVTLILSPPPASWHCLVRHNRFPNLVS